MQRSMILHYLVSQHGGIAGSPDIRGKELLRVERGNHLQRASKSAQESICRPLLD